MGRKSHNTSFDVRQLVIFHHTKGLKALKLSKMFNIPRSTVYDIINRFEKEDRIDFIPQRGRLRILSDQDEWFIVRTIANCPKTLETPPQSPDCNPIEHVWDYLDRKVHEAPILNKNDLKNRLLEEWQRIPLEYLNKLVSSMADRLEAVIKAKGKHTKY